VSQPNEDIQHVLVNGRVWYRMYIPDLGERWCKLPGRQVATWDKLTSMGEVYLMHVDPVPVNL